MPISSKLRQDLLSKATLMMLICSTKLEKSVPMARPSFLETLFRVKMTKINWILKVRKILVEEKRVAAEKLTIWTKRWTSLDLLARPMFCTKISNRWIDKANRLRLLNLKFTQKVCKVIHRLAEFKDKDKQSSVRMELWLNLASLVVSLLNSVANYLRLFRTRSIVERRKVVRKTIRGQDKFLMLNPTTRSSFLENIANLRRRKEEQMVEWDLPETTVMKRDSK